MDMTGAFRLRNVQWYSSCPTIRLVSHLISCATFASIVFGLTAKTVTKEDLRLDNTIYLPLTGSASNSTSREELASEDEGFGSLDLYFGRDSSNVWISFNFE